MLIFKLDNNPIFDILFLPLKSNKKSLIKTIPSEEPESYPFFIEKKFINHQALLFLKHFFSSEGHKLNSRCT